MKKLITTVSVLCIFIHNSPLVALYSCARPELVEGFPRALEETLQQVQGERIQKRIISKYSSSYNDLVIHSYYMQRLSPSTYFLSLLYKQRYWYKPCNIVQEENCIQIDSVMFFHPTTRSCLQKMLQTGSLKPLLVLLKEVKNYHLLQDKLLFHEFFLLIFIVYKQILFHECEQSSHALKNTTLETIIIISNTISQLPIAEVLNAIDMLIVELPPFLEKYEFHSSIGWKAWFKKYWWVPPVFGIWFGLKILLRLQRPFFYYSPYMPRPQIPLGEPIPIISSSEQITTNDPALDDIMNTAVHYR